MEQRVEALEALVAEQGARIEALASALGSLMQVLEPKGPSLLEQSKDLARRVRERRGE